ncbi:MAG: diaminopimelate epimerase [Deltaproteobacteria bacterium]|nr:diaminopimelate epimerase [Deltaproteobacteria bacterium]
MKIKFTKLEGAGNDYIYIDAINDLPENLINDTNFYRELAIKISDRHFGVGSDGVIVILPCDIDSKDADFKMRMFNADGSEGEMCGNGIRCFAKYVYDHKLTSKNPIKINTLAGIKTVQVFADDKINGYCDNINAENLNLQSKSNNNAVDADVNINVNADTFFTDSISCIGGIGNDADINNSRGENIVLINAANFNNSGGFVKYARVEMGKPEFESSKIPVNINKSEIIDEPLKAGDIEFKINCVSMGNPHCVIFVNDVDNFNVGFYGPLIENNPLFPKKINVEFTQIISDNYVKVRTWERGSGETLACGTGACGVYSIIKKTVNNNIDSLNVVLRGGVLQITGDINKSVLMTGPANEVFSGYYDFEF